MPSDDAMRASDQDRERAVEILRDGYACGRLTLAEFDERTTAAFAGRTWGELRALTRDLPAGQRQMPGQHGLLPPPAGRPPGPAPPIQPTGAHGPRPPASWMAAEGARLLPMLLIALIWLMLTVGSRAGGALIPLVFLLLMAVRSGGRVRCGLGSRRHRPYWREPPEQPGGRA